MTKKLGLIAYNGLIQFSCTIEIVVAFGVNIEIFRKERERKKRRIAFVLGS